MGSGKRVTFWKTEDLTIGLGFWMLDIGFGKGYDK